jgi:hypothetical protein
MRKQIIRKAITKPAPKRPPTNPGTPEEKIAEALRASAGFFAPAGAMLGLTRSAIGWRVKRSPLLQEVLRETKESLLDIAESELLKKIKAGNMTALCFFLKCRGKDRGYIERSEVNTTITGQSGVMVVPGVAADVDAWLNSPDVQKTKEKTDEKSIH